MEAPRGQGKMQDLDLLLDLSDNMTGKTICVLSDSCAAPSFQDQEVQERIRAYHTASGPVRRIEG